MWYNRKGVLLRGCLTDIITLPIYNIIIFMSHDERGSDRSSGLRRSETKEFIVTSILLGRYAVRRMTTTMPLRPSGCSPMRIEHFLFAKLIYLFLLDSLSIIQRPQITRSVISCSNYTEASAQCAENVQRFCSDLHPRILPHSYCK